jgi:hypothetical protein
MFKDITFYVLPFLTHKETDQLMFVSRYIFEALRTSVYLREKRKKYIQQYKKVLAYMLKRNDMDDSVLQPDSPMDCKDTWLGPAVLYYHAMRTKLSSEEYCLLFTPNV